jgi:hypothetical protein
VSDNTAIVLLVAILMAMFVGAIWIAAAYSTGC